MKFEDYRCLDCSYIMKDVLIKSGNIPKTKKCVECGGKCVRTWSVQINIPKKHRAV